MVLAAVSTTLTNVAYVREHDAAASLPALSLRRPVHSLHLLLTDRTWMLGFAMESSGFASYAAALALAPLAVCLAPNATVELSTALRNTAFLVVLLPFVMASPRLTPSSLGADRRPRRTGLPP